VVQTAPISPTRGDPYDLAAIVHVHSTYSDGNATVPQIVEAAADAEADAVLLTDHDTLQARRDGFEGWHHGVLLLAGLEISPQAGHLLAFGLDEAVPHDGRTGQEICAAVMSAGGLGFPAHPWSELRDCETTGVELWSLVTEAAEAARTPRQLASFISRPEEAIDHPPERSVAEWDRLCLTRRVVAIGGLDAHRGGLPVRGGVVLSPLRLAHFFRMLRTHLLCERPPSGSLEADRGLILTALREGRCYLGRDSLARTRGFRYYAEGPAGFLPMGSESSAPEWTLHVRLPLEAEVRLIRDGEPIQTLIASTLEVDASEPGVYRVEAHLEAFGRRRTWIVSNPIYVRA
jgi:hypothetical protein